jgi:hypothetical protein
MADIRPGRQAEAVGTSGGPADPTVGARHLSIEVRGSDVELPASRDIKATVAVRRRTAAHPLPPSGFG